MMKYLLPGLLLLLFVGCPSAAPPSQDEDGDGVRALSAGGGDCDDSDPTVFPGAPEVCDEQDNDCDGAIDEEAEGALPWYPDVDADGFGDEGAVPFLACARPDGFVAEDEATDCHDGDADIYPGAPETDCTDPTDYDCDGLSDYADEDEDGVPACEDCDDQDATANPGATEICDGVDNDCNGTVDDSPEGADDWFADTDGDGIGAGEAVFACSQPEGHVANGGDCDDADPTIYPGAPETDCTDPTDYNCDGSVAFDDLDGDGVPACEDCDDTDASALPGGTEVCDGVDNDCLGGPDDGLTFTDWYLDADVDGWGTGSAVSTCDGAPTGSWSTTPGDCNDSSSAANPGGTEICDGLDNDCVDGVDTGFDVDGDGVTTCAGDCDDGDPDINPNEPEVPYNGVDEDCSGTGLTDVDGDGYDGVPAGGGDCDDNAPTTNPGVAVDVLDGDDNDCDGATDEGPFTYTYAANIQPIWNASCNGGFCHDPVNPAGGLNLTSPSYNRLVNVPSGDVPGMDFVEPLEPSLSYLFHKLNNTQGSVGGSGSAMPRNAPLLPNATRQMIQTWILQGAPP